MHSNFNSAQAQNTSFDVTSFLCTTGVGKKLIVRRKNQTIFAQGDECDALFYIQTGIVKISILSEHGKVATVALLKAGDFVGEECISSVQAFRSASATALNHCVLLRIAQSEISRVVHTEPAMSNLFVSYLLAKTDRMQADLVDQLFHSSEKRLARTLLLLSNFGQDGRSKANVPPISQETLAAMVGCTRPRVNFFLNRFRKLGFIEYGECIQVNQALLQVVLQD